MNQKDFKKFCKEPMNHITDLTISEIQKRLKSLRKRYEKTGNEIRFFEERLKEICVCNDFETIYRDVSGSYLDKSARYEYQKCKVCGKRTKEKLIGEGWYE